MRKRFNPFHRNRRPKLNREVCQVKYVHGRQTCKRFTHKLDRFLDHHKPELRSFMREFYEESAPIEEAAWQVAGRRNGKAHALTSLLDNIAIVGSRYLLAHQLAKC